MLQRIIRLIFLSFITFISITIFTTTPLPYLEFLAIKYLKIKPWWDPELLEVVQWNRLVNKYGILVATEKFNRREFE